MKLTVLLLIVGISLCGCSGTSKYFKTECPVCNTVFCEFYSDKPAAIDVDGNKSDTKGEPFFKVEMPLGKIGG